MLVMPGFPFSSWRAASKTGLMPSSRRRSSTVMLNDFPRPSRGARSRCRLRLWPPSRCAPLRRHPHSGKCGHRSGLPGVLGLVVVPEFIEPRERHSTAPHFVAELKQQDAVVVLFHQQPEVVVLLLEAGVFVSNDGFAGEAVKGIAQKGLRVASGHIHPCALAVHECDEFADGRLFVADGQDGLLGEAFLDHDGLQHAVDHGHFQHLGKPLLVDGEAVFCFGFSMKLLRTCSERLSRCRRFSRSRLVSERRGAWYSSRWMRCHPYCVRTGAETSPSSAKAKAASSKGRPCGPCRIAEVHRPWFGALVIAVLACESLKLPLASSAAKASILVLASSAPPSFRRGGS